MPYRTWHDQTVQKVAPYPDWLRYVSTLNFGLVIYGAFYLYTLALEIPNPTNKAVADAAIVLVGSSMLLTAICYFWDFLDTKIIYRKHLGLIGYAFALVHIILSWDAFLRLFKLDLWLDGSLKAPIAGLLATTIFTIMALVSNKLSVKALGGQTWRRILRTGYLAIFFVFLHVFWLKSRYWISWWTEGATRPPSLSLLVSIFILIVLVSRLALAIHLRLQPKPTNPKQPSNNQS